MKTYKVFEETFKGHIIIAIWEVDPCGNKVGKFPFISFGTAKGHAIVDNLDQIKKILGVK